MPRRSDTAKPPARQIKTTPPRLKRGWTAYGTHGPPQALHETGVPNRTTQRSATPSFAMPRNEEHDGVVDKNEELADALVPLVDGIAEEIRLKLQADANSMEAKKAQHEKQLLALSSRVNAELEATKVSIVKELYDAYERFKTRTMLWSSDAPPSLASLDPRVAGGPTSSSQRVSIMPIDEPLQQKAVEFVASTTSFSAVVFYDPVRQKMDAVMHLPSGQALPDVNRVLKSLVNRSKLPATWGQTHSTGTGLPQDNYLMRLAQQADDHSRCLESESVMLELQFVDDAALASRARHGSETWI
ncbi:uncharacterized protein JN550_013381 [Neoarthrinium moseri]|uniref:uncharacterized protein n=1 Tax=Neoarthrinium moseri TaxID=1658444 RepID=UPI001FDE8C70|nr:uncharacterized protein JN550_013381 [Neoarthrinium moseri]KAI1857246.1 hypothetical protein JN550_013381 [Neoarthrinium moseri]